jgi:membrane-associated protease RseP (regulator of RpoE activity)
MREENVGTINCPSCGATLVAGLRFCRMCGYRLGEGVDEYIQTQLLDPNAAPTATAQPRATDPFAPRQTWGASPMQPMQPFGTNSLRPQGDSSLSRLASACNPRRAGWWTWMILAFVMLTVMGGVFSAVRRNVGGGRARAVAAMPTSSILDEVDNFDTADGGGAFITGLSGPDSSLERAGLIGGDIITSFDGKTVRDEDAIRKILAGVPPGKTVEVIYIRDSEPPKKTMLTTIGKGDFRGMAPIDTRPGGRGILGIDASDPERVRVPNTNIYGVELGDINRNGPADLAGLKKGDIIIQFGEKLVRTPGDLRLRIYEAIPNGIVNIIFMRDGQRMEIPVKMGRNRD